MTITLAILIQIVYLKLELMTITVKEQNNKVLLTNFNGLWLSTELGWFLTAIAITCCVTDINTSNNADVIAKTSWDIWCIYWIQGDIVAVDIWWSIDPDTDTSITAHYCVVSDIVSFTACLSLLQVLCNIYILIILHAAWCKTIHKAKSGQQICRSNSFTSESWKLHASKQFGVYIGPPRYV